jgi:hypothetical protein
MAMIAIAIPTFIARSSASELATQALVTLPLTKLAVYTIIAPNGFMVVIGPVIFASLNWENHIGVLIVLLSEHSRDKTSLRLERFDRLKLVPKALWAKT